MNKLEFCQQFVYLKGQPISFDDRPYLPAIYGINHGNFLIRASRQVEKSTFLANTIIYEACRNPNAEILFVSPRAEQAHTFSNARFLPILEQSPLLRRMLLSWLAVQVESFGLIMREGFSIVLCSIFGNGRRG